MSKIVKEVTPFSIQLDGKVYPITCTYRIKNTPGDMWDTDRPTIQIRAKLPKDYPDTKVIQRVKDYYDDNGFMSYKKDGIAQLEIKAYKTYFYVIRFFVYPALFPKDLLYEEKIGLKGLGRYLMCNGLNTFIKMGFIRRNIKVVAGGFGMIERDPFTDKETETFYQLYPHYLSELHRKYKELQEYRANENPDHIIDFEKYAKSEAALTTYAISLVNYYRTYGFEPDDKNIFDTFIEGGIHMSAKTDIVLEHCNN